MQQVFRRIQADLPKGLARLDEELENLIAGYLSAIKVAYRREAEDGHVRFEFGPSPRLPEGFEKGGTVVAGRGNDREEFDSLHPGHPLVQAAVEEARAATQQQFRVGWKLERFGARGVAGVERKAGEAGIEPGSLRRL